MDMAEFVLARVAEDEAAAREVEKASGRAWAALPVGLLGLARWTPARVLAECDAKRRIVEQFTMIKLVDEWHDAGPAEGAYVKMQTVLALLAAPYATHPDYRCEWEPLARV